MTAAGADSARPGLRPDYYASFVTDPDGNNVEAVRRTPTVEPRASRRR
jgi:hypothetical protein